MDVVQYIKKENGFHGFYSGLKPDLMRLIPSNAILFICYEYARKLWRTHIMSPNEWRVLIEKSDFPN